MGRMVYGDVQSAVNRLRNNGVNVDQEGGVVTIPVKMDVGIKLWGAIDYLKSYHKYVWVRA